MAALYDSSASGTSASATSVSFSHTNNGNLLFVAVINLGTTSPSGVTYNNVALNNFGDDLSANGYRISYWFLSSSGTLATGANTVKVSYAGLTADIVAVSGSYTNVNLVNFEDGDGTGSGTGTSFSLSQSSVGGTGLYKDNLFAFWIFSLITSTQPSSNIGNARLDVTGATVRCRLFDFFPASSSTTANITVGNGAYWWALTFIASGIGMRKTFHSTGNAVGKRTVMGWGQ